jgi:hypothetical protein
VCLVDAVRGRLAVLGKRELPAFFDPQFVAHNAPQCEQRGPPSIVS